MGKRCGCGLPTTPDPTRIIVHGAREHNLQGVCFEIPKGKLVALTGPSGSGKSTIAVDVLQRECLRQYLESLGMITDHLAKANVQQIMGLSPSIGVPQRVTDFNPRSTVGTKTGILTILRNLFAAIGVAPERPLERLTMAHFSFNSAVGACPACKGLGEVIGVDVATLLDEEKSLLDGGVAIWDRGTAQHYAGVIGAASRYFRFPFDVTLPIGRYSQEMRDFLLHGIHHSPFVKAHPAKAPKKVGEGRFEGLIPYLLGRYRSAPTLPSDIAPYLSQAPCLECAGTRLGPLGRKSTVCGKTLTEIAALSLTPLLEWVGDLTTSLSESDQPVIDTLAGPLQERISNLIEVGLDYLTLDRPLPSLSAGEAQRVRLAGLLASELTGVLYVLDEPTAGLHPHDTAKLLKTLRRIQEAGNTVLVIEHDLDVIRSVDYVIELGPGGGSQGGKIVAFGSPAEVMAPALPSPVRPPRPSTQSLTIRGACHHNLRGIDVTLPLNQLVVLTGVSGSGKSSLLFGILDPAARRYLYAASALPGEHTSIEGLEHFNRVVTVDQTTLKKAQASRSNVATYTKLFDPIRDLFASLPQAKIRRFGADKFSFNTSDERCQNCNGTGSVSIDMAFLPDIETGCPLCGGRRFTEELLSIQFKGHSIADILDLSVGEALPLFHEHKGISTLLELLKEVGLGYLTLGQSTSTLSGGEAQRIKLAAELSKSGRESTLFLLDEPTSGLHFREVERLLAILTRLVSLGNTVVLIEHNLEVIAAADTIIDFGPGGGLSGGEVVVTGTLHQIAAHPHSKTGRGLSSSRFR
ncbi:MAG: ABC-ATPase UvrA [Parachlamydiales bacterium]